MSEGLHDSGKMNVVRKKLGTHQERGKKKNHALVNEMQGPQRTFAFVCEIVTLWAAFHSDAAKIEHLLQNKKKY